MTRLALRLARRVTLLSLAAGGVAVSAQELPRTPWDQPDLQGVWDFRTITPMERPEELSDRPFLTPEEATEIENVRALEDARYDDERPIFGRGSVNAFWADRGSSVVQTGRTSLVVDPTDGRVPALTRAAERAREAMNEARKNTGMHEPTPGGWVDDLGPTGLRVRCVVGQNSGPPMTPSGADNNVQIFQTADTVVLYNERIHNARVVPLDGRPYTELRQWTGESRGYWEEDTLVVETKNFLRETDFMGGGTSAELHVTERFTRPSVQGLLYSVTVNDPLTWTRPWTYEIAMVPNPDQIYEFACHEGNYSMPVILAGALNKEASERSR